jgi:hypothetical protein
MTHQPFHDPLTHLWHFFELFFICLKNTIGLTRQPDGLTRSNPIINRVVFQHTNPMGRHEPDPSTQIVKPTFNAL